MTIERYWLRIVDCICLMRPLGLNGKLESLSFETVLIRKRWFRFQICKSY